MTQAVTRFDKHGSWPGLVLAHLGALAEYLNLHSVGLSIQNASDWVTNLIHRDYHLKGLNAY